MNHRALAILDENRQPIVINLDVVRPENVRPDWMKQIDALCEAIDRERVGMMEPVGPGRTLLDDWRALLMWRAVAGLAPPAHWSSRESDERMMQERLATFGTREWRKAFPWIASDLEKNFHERQLEFGPAQLI